MSRRILAWLFMAMFVVGSFAAPARSSQEDGNGRSVWAAGAAGVETAGNDDDGRAAYGYRGGRKVNWNRRSLGTRSTLPPAPVSNKMKAAAMPGPPPPPKKM